jgi:hypothetical protein
VGAAGEREGRNDENQQAHARRHILEPHGIPPPFLEGCSTIVLYGFARTKRDQISELL